MTSITFTIDIATVLIKNVRTESYCVLLALRLFYL